ncbi:MAG: hypothetical protein HFF84_02305 [Oscillibacter sp.]|nr:hypothetical protein [Oscillibacter sp.]
MKLSVREMVLFGLLGGLMFAAKIVVAHLPNIEPVSLFVILIAACFSWKGLYAVYTYVFLEYAVWGFGLWSVCYLYVWLILFCAARLLRNMESRLGWAVLAGGFGLLFGALCALVYWVSGGWAAAVAWWISGIPMDLMHGAGNFVITFALFLPLRKRLMTLRRQYQL